MVVIKITNTCAFTARCPATLRSIRFITLHILCAPASVINIGHVTTFHATLAFIAETIRSLYRSNERHGNLEGTSSHFIRVKSVWNYCFECQTLWSIKQTVPEGSTTTLIRSSYITVVLIDFTILRCKCFSNNIN